MKKFTVLLAVVLTALFCITSCSDKKSDSKDQTETNYPLSEFSGTSWSGTDAVALVTLNVNSTTEMTLTYMESSTLSKKTDEPLKSVEVKITYTFNEEEGSFSGKGNDQQNYSGELKSKTEMAFTMPRGSVNLIKK